MPATVGADTMPVVKQLTAGLEFTIPADDIQYAVHTGGPAILRGTQEALGVGDEQLQVPLDACRVSALSSKCCQCHLCTPDVNWLLLQAGAPDVFC